jgi:hypothetical protein
MATATGSGTSPTPGHRTAGTLIRAVLTYVQAPDDSELQEVARECLNSAIAFVNARRWNKLTSQTDLSMTASDDDIGVPADFKEPLSLFELNSSSERVKRVPFLPLQTMLFERENTTVAGNPQHYSINYKTREVILDVPPSSGYVATVPTMRLHYFRRLAELSNDSSTIDNEPEFDWFLIWQARAEIAMIRDPGKVMFAQRRAQEILRELRRSDTDQMTDWESVVI